jgi:hypothetical protein
MKRFQISLVLYVVGMARTANAVGRGALRSDGAAPLWAFDTPFWYRFYL